MGQRRHVLAEIDGEVGRAIGLVRGDARARHVAQHLGAHRLQPAPSVGTLGLALHEARPELARLWSCHIQKAPFSPTTASTGQKRAMWSHQPAGRPVTGMTRNPAFFNASMAP